MSIHPLFDINLTCYTDPFRFSLIKDYVFIVAVAPGLGVPMVIKMTPANYIIVFSAALVILLSMGTRHSFGLFQTPVSEAFGSA